MYRHTTSIYQLTEKVHDLQKIVKKKKYTGKRIQALKSGVESTFYNII